MKNIILILLFLTYSHGLQMNVWKPLVKLNKLNKHKPTIVFDNKPLVIWYSYDNWIIFNNKNNIYKKAKIQTNNICLENGICFDYDGNCISQKSKLKIKIYPTIIFNNTLWYWNTSCFPYSKMEYKAYMSKIFINVNELF